MVVITVTDFDAQRRPASSAPSRQFLTVSAEPPPLTPPDESAESSETSLEEPVPSAAWRHAPQVDTRAAPPSARPMSVYARLYSGIGHRNARCSCCRARAGLEPEPEFAATDHGEGHRGHRVHGTGHRGHGERHRGGTAVGLRDRYAYLDLETGAGGYVSWNVIVPVLLRTKIICLFHSILVRRWYYCGQVIYNNPS